MPLTKYAHFFGPEELDTLTAAFDSAWTQLAVSSGINLSSKDQITLVRERLADCIVGLARNKRTLDAQQLAQAALRSLAGG
jgi:hypothetical protein